VGGARLNYPVKLSGEALSFGAGQRLIIK